MVVVYAILAGIFLSFGFGSVFFALIQNSVDHGYKAGIKIALGVSFSDLFLSGFAILGTSFLPEIPNFQYYSRIVGAILLLGMAVGQFRNSELPQTVQTNKASNYLYFSAKGFFLNILNPVNFLTWVFISSYLKSHNYSFAEEITFIVICIISIFISESLIAYYSQKISKRLNKKVLSYFKIASAIVFVGLAVKMLYDLKP